MEILENTNLAKLLGLRTHKKTIDFGSDVRNLVHKTKIPFNNVNKVYKYNAKEMQECDIFCKPKKNVNYFFVGKMYSSTKDVLFRITRGKSDIVFDNQLISRGWKNAIAHATYCFVVEATEENLQSKYVNGRKSSYDIKYRLNESNKYKLQKRLTKYKINKAITNCDFNELMKKVTNAYVLLSQNIIEPSDDFVKRIDKQSSLNHEDVYSFSMILPQYIEPLVKCKKYNDVHNIKNETDNEYRSYFYSLYNFVKKF